MPTDLEGWSSPVYHAVASKQTLLLCGVPQTFFLLNFFLGVFLVLTGQMVAGTLWWRAPLGCGVLHLIAMGGTAYEPEWMPMVRRYVRLRTHYEG